MRYKLTVLEQVAFIHEITIDTDHEIDELCDYLQDEIKGSSGFVDLMIKLKNEKDITNLLKVVSGEEDADRCGGDWEIETYEAIL